MKHAKRFIIPGAIALALGGIGVGTTFALFTSRAQTKIEIAAGKVVLESDVVINSVASLNTNDAGTEKVSDTYATFENGGAVEVKTVDGAKVVDITKMTPGDKVELTISIVNKSNVAIRSRFEEKHTYTSDVDLYNALDIDYVAQDRDGNDITYSFMDWEVYEAAQTDSGYALSTIHAVIEFKDGDNGNILYGDDNNDNIYQDANCSLTFTQSAVQGNANVLSRLEEMNKVLADSTAVNSTMYNALKEADVRASYLKGYVWDSLNDRFEYEAEVETSPRYFKVYDSMPALADQDFSIYADFSGVSAVTLNAVGFDAGDVNGIAIVTYNGSTEGHSVIIRTNGSDLTIDAVNDDVYHYGTAGSINILSVAGNSYHEAGKVNGLIEIANGHIEFNAPETYNVKVTTDNVTASNVASAEVNVYSEVALEQEDFVNVEIHNADELVEADNFATLKEFVTNVNVGAMKKPVIYLEAGDYNFTETLNLNKTISIFGVPGKTKFHGFYNPDEKITDVSAFNIATELENQTFRLGGFDVEDFAIYKEEGVMIANNVKAVSGINANTPISAKTYIENARFYCCGVSELRLVGGEYFVENCLFDSTNQSYYAPNLVQINGNPYESTDRLTKGHFKNSRFVKLSGDDEDDFSATALLACAETDLWVDGCSFEKCYVPIRVYQTESYHKAPTLKDIANSSATDCTYTSFYTVYLTSVSDLPNPLDDYEVKEDGAYNVYSIEKTLGGMEFGIEYYIHK